MVDALLYDLSMLYFLPKTVCHIVVTPNVVLAAARDQEQIVFALPARGFAERKAA
jgi:hypothetical protein